MPPSSRGSNGAQRLSAHGQRRQHDVGRERQRKRQQQEERKRSATIWAQDPLTLIITLVSYPVLIVAFALLHVGYYVTLKAQASLRFQQTVVQHLRTQQRPFVQRIIRGSNATERGRPSIEQACNECAQARLAIMPTMAHQAQGLRKMAAKAAGDRVRVLPRHVALALGAKPVRTRTLLARLMLQPFRSSDRIDTASQPGTGGTGMTSEADREQRQFALANLRAMLRYCSLVSVAELTVFDENGYLSGLLEGQHRETFVEDFVLDAARRPTDSENDRRSISTTRIHIDAIFRRPFQAVAPNGVAVSEGPVSIDSCETRQIRVNVLGPNEARAALVRVMTIVQQRTQGKAQVVKVDDNMIQNVLTGTYICLMTTSF